MTDRGTAGTPVGSCAVWLLQEGRGWGTRPANHLVTEAKKYDYAGNLKPLCAMGRENKSQCRSSPTDVFQ